MPIQTKSPPMSVEEHETTWRKLHWPVDEIFMAWNYARYVNTVVEAGKKEYDLPVFVKAWLQQPNHARPGTYPSGGPVPQVHDIWRAAAPAADVLAFIPETSTNATNVLSAFGKFNAIGFSPFFIERSAAADTELAAAYGLVSQLAPAIGAQQGKETITAARMNQGDAPLDLKLGNYTLTLTYVGLGRVPIAPDPSATAGARDPKAPEAAVILIAAGPDEFYFGAVGGGIQIAFTPITPGRQIVGLGDAQQGKFVQGQWRVVRQLGGDDTGQGEILTVRPNAPLRVTVYHYE